MDRAHACTYAKVVSIRLRNQTNTRLQDRPYEHAGTLHTHRERERECGENFKVFRMFTVILVSGPTKQTRVRETWTCSLCRSSVRYSMDTGAIDDNRYNSHVHYGVRHRITIHGFGIHSQGHIPLYQFYLSKTARVYRREMEWHGTLSWRCYVCVGVRGRLEQWRHKLNI
jgi:hypothetical protein